MDGVYGVIETEAHKGVENHSVGRSVSRGEGEEVLEILHMNI